MQPATAIDPAAWITARLHRFGTDAGSVVPDGFEAYARVFHAMHRAAEDGTKTRVRWRDVAAANGRTLESEMKRLDVSAAPTQVSSTGERLWDDKPSLGCLPRDAVARLVAVLEAQTETRDSCWFAVWDGWADLRFTERVAPRFSVPGREMLLLHGRVADVLETLGVAEWDYRSPNIWWPDDRAWCVATEIDFSWTYVGGSSACINAVLADAELEAVAMPRAAANSIGPPGLAW